MRLLVPDNTGFPPFATRKMSANIGTLIAQGIKEHESSRALNGKMRKLSEGNQLRIELPGLCAVLSLQARSSSQA